MYSMDEKTGRCAILFPHGVLFRNEESDMREKLVRGDYVECVIGLAPNLFYNSPMEACIVICRMNKTTDRRGKVLFINAVNDVERKNAQSYLTDAHIKRIADAYANYKNDDGLLDMEAPEVYAYSIYSVIAEKFEAFVSLGLANGRYKDFYDIYVLSANCDLDGNELKNAIIETFTHRKTGFDDIVAFESDFTEDSVRQGRWKAFIKKKKAMMKVEFEEAIAQSKKLLLPIVEAIEQDKEFNQCWDKDKKEWI